MIADPLANSSVGNFLTTYEGYYKTGFGQEIDFYEHSRGRDPYDGPDRDISDLWVVVAKSSLSTTGDEMFEMVGWNSNAKPTAHSAVSVPQHVDDSQYAYLPNYVRPGMTFAVDLFFDNAGEPKNAPSNDGYTTETTLDGKVQMHFGAGGSYPEYRDHYVVRLENRTDPPQVVIGRETEELGGFIHYDHIDWPGGFEGLTRYTPVVHWKKDGHFDVFFHGNKVSTEGNTSSVTTEGEGIGYEVSRDIRAWADSYRIGQ